MFQGLQGVTAGNPSAKSSTDPVTSGAAFTSPGVLWISLVHSSLMHYFWDRYSFSLSVFHNASSSLVHAWECRRELWDVSKTLAPWQDILKRIEGCHRHSWGQDSARMISGEGNRARKGRKHLHHDGWKGQSCARGSLILGIHKCGWTESTIWVLVEPGYFGDSC